ncbi:hypothetical protein DICPUDRAFT_55079 [Dictyostelium purpureum]|uniref:Uncharacterized protein n=1 Tax=Dictyostelium purpureum TaxID=5786 RepID=F0ZKA9_DICPU|nr:uncharacterized protein DICPUDRAFT_55079 [Dictyostelium purpureum]EGC35611.1 hypothetical protein DICPUDRAFT_55079 [Dictyostelium purpureum]|eukprot:XP_003287848.1 hypothetical protein DICPUDRAFT_55079 [Dictyostelium purpureum]
MLDEILSVSIKEIASNCSLGCTPTELWEYINGFGLSNGRKLILNDYMKGYIHRLLLNQTNISLLPNPNFKANTPQQDEKKEIVNNNSNNNYNNNNNNNNDNSNNREAPIPTLPLPLQKTSPAASDDEKEKIEEKMVSIKNEEEKEEIIQTQPRSEDNKVIVHKNKPVRTSIFTWKRESTLAKSDISTNLNKDYWLEPSDAFIYIADKYNQMVALGITEEHRITPFQFKLLEQVSKSRIQGALVRDLSNLFNIDPRNIFTPIKDLILKGIIIKEEVMSTRLSSRVSTGRIYLQKYNQRSFNPVKENWVPKYWQKAAFCYFLDIEPGKAMPQAKLMAKVGSAASTFKKIRRILFHNGYTSESEEKGKETIIKLEKPLDETFWNFIKSDPDEGANNDEDNENEEDNDDDKKSKTTTPTSDQNENEEDDMSGQSSNLVMELPIDQQIFNFIKESGKNGITQKEIFSKSGNISSKNISTIIRKLIISFNVKILPVSVGKQFQYRIYADPKDHIHQTSVEDSNAIIPYIQEYGNSLVLAQPELENDKRKIPRTLMYLKRKKEVHKFIQDSVGVLSFQIILHMRQINDTKFEQKTLSRVLEDLLKENKVSITTIHTQYYCGANKNLTFLYDSIFKITDPEVQEIIESIKSIQTEPENGLTPRSKVLDEEDEEDFKNSDTNLHPIVKPSRKQYNPISLKYGFVKGSIVRAKLLHIFLWNFSNRNKTQHSQSPQTSEDQNNATERQLTIQKPKELAEKTKIILNYFIKTLPISDYLKIISQATPIKNLSHYIKQETPIINLPIEIKNQLFQRRTFINRIGKLMAILRQLDLMEISHNPNKVADYSFLRYAGLKNELSEVKLYDFESLESVHNYWTDLQFLSLLPREPHNKEPPADFILDRMKFLKNIVLWGVPRIPLTQDIKVKLVSRFRYLEEKEEKILERDELRQIATHYHVSYTKLCLFYKRYLKKRDEPEGISSVTKTRSRKPKDVVAAIEEEEENDDDDDDDYGIDDDNFGNEGAYSDVFKQKRVKISTNRVNRQSSVNKIAYEKRQEFKTIIAPYRRFKWTALEDSQLLKKYTEVFRDFFNNIPEGVKNNANNEYYITPSGIPSMLNPLWDKLGEEIQKIGQLCYRRMRLLVKKYPSYKNFHKSNSTPDLPLSIKEFNALFTIQYNKSENLELFEFSRFNKTDEAIMRDKLIFLISIPEQEYSFNYGVKILGSNKILSRQVLDSLYNDRILKSLKSRNANRSITFCVQKIYFKNNCLNDDFFQENRTFMTNIKEIPLYKLDDNELFQYDPLTSGGSVSSMLNLLSNNKVLPIVGVKDSFEKEKPPKSRDFSGGRRLDLMLNKINVAYLIREYINYSYIENERKRAINPDVILPNDPLESEKKKFNKIFEIGDDDQEMKEQEKEKEQKDQRSSKRLKASNDNNKSKNYQSVIDKYNNRFLIEDFKILFIDKLVKMDAVGTEKTNDYIANFVLATQEVFRIIHSNKTKGVKRINIINHFLNNINNSNEIIQHLIIEEPAPEIEFTQYLYEKLPSFILELKSIGLIDTLFTFSEKKYVSKQFFIDSLLPIDYTLQLEYQQKLKHEQKYGVPEGKEPLPQKFEPPLNYRDKRLIKPWLEPNGSINRNNFNKMFTELITNVYHYPGSTLETISHRLQKYSPSLLKEAAMILQQLDYLTIMEYDYKPPTLFTPSEFITKPFNPLNDGCTQLIFNSTTKFFNLQSDFSVYLLTEDF